MPPYPSATLDPTVALRRLPNQPEAFLMDPRLSFGLRLKCLEDGLTYLDFAGFHGSQPLGMNPPEFDADPGFRRRLLLSAMHKPSCSDVFTEDFAEFFARFDETFADPALDHTFLIEGGSPAVENALKVAFDWKALRAGADPARRPPWSVLHLTGSFHGRTGYTLSLTNTRPTYTDHFPTFDWPRVPAPQVRFPIDVDAVAVAEARSLAAIERAFTASGDRIACFIAEPIQSEGGDNHLRGEYLRAVQRLCHEHDALFVLDEVQTGAGATGMPWAFQAHALEPDIVVFGKKLQVCGIMAGRRVHEVAGAFETPARIGSTWGANLTDLVRATKIMSVIAERSLLAHVAAVGKHLLQRLQEVRDLSGGYVENARASGVLAAIDLPDADARDGVLTRLRYEERVLALPGGSRSIRFRPPLTVTPDDVDLLAAALTRTCAAEEAEGG